MSLILTPVINTKDIIAKIGTIKKKMEAGLERGLIEGGKLIHNESKRFVPVLTGALRGSARVSKTGSGFTTDVVVSYGSENEEKTGVDNKKAIYAVYVHQDMEKAHGARFNRKWAYEIANAHTPAQRKYYFNRKAEEQAKFLERPAREQKDAVLNIIAKEVKK